MFAISNEKVSYWRNQGLLLKEIIYFMRVFIPPDCNYTMIVTINF